MNYNEVISWIEINFLSEIEDNLEYSDWQTVSDANYYLTKFKIPYKGDWQGIYITFKNIYFFFNNDRSMIGYSMNDEFVKKNLMDWDLCKLYDIPYTNHAPVYSEDSWGVLRHLATNSYLGIDSEVGNSLVNVLFESKIISKKDWDIIQDNDSTFILVDGEEVSPDDLEFLEINISLRDEEYES